MGKSAATSSTAQPANVSIAAENIISEEEKSAADTPTNISIAAEDITLEEENLECTLSNAENLCQTSEPQESQIKELRRSSRESKRPKQMDIYEWAKSGPTTLVANLQPKKYTNPNKMYLISAMESQSRTEPTSLKAAKLDPDWTQAMDER